jgi:hypothetical protein
MAAALCLPDNLVFNPKTIGKHLVYVFTPGWIRFVAIDRGVFGEKIQNRSG